MLDRSVLSAGLEAYAASGGARIAAPTQEDVNVVVEQAAASIGMMFAYLNWCSSQGMGESVLDFIVRTCGDLPEEKDLVQVKAWVNRVIENRNEIFRLQTLEVAYRRVAQRKAMRFLRSLLSSRQRRHLETGRCFTVRASAGGVYRLWPATGGVHKVRRRGLRWRITTQFCLHDPKRRLPPADVTVAHLLMLRNDEGEFLRKANATTRRFA